MKKLSVYICAVFVLLMLCLSVPSTASAVVYNYTGSTFSNVQGSYTTSMRISGLFEVNASIAPNSAFPTDISASITGYAFNDGVQTLNNGNSAIVDAFVETDSNGNIGLWSFEFSSPFPATQGNPASSILTFNVSGLHRDYVRIGTCAQVTDGVCTDISPLVDSAFIEIDSGFNSAPWASSAPSEIVPTMNKWGMIIFMVLAGLGAIYYLKRKRIEG